MAGRWITVDGNDACASVAYPRINLIVTGTHGLVMSDRAAAADHRTSAAFHGLVTTIIAFPILWESVTRFQLLTPNAAAIGVTPAGGLKLPAEDLPRSRPATLFIALALDGGALIVAPRLLRTGTSNAPLHATPT